MVILFEWHPMAMDQTSRSGLPLSGEETDLEALSSPLVGYLGKVQKRAASLENCPWCSSKGLTFALRSYHINLHDSIPVCTNPQCLFPLVSRSLEDVLASLVPVDHPVGCKRKNALALGKENPPEPAHKRQRLNEQNMTGMVLNQAEQDAPTVSDVQTGLSREDVEKVNGYHRESLDVEKVGCNAPGFEDIVLDKGSEKAPCTEAFNLLTSSYLPEHLQTPKDLLNIDGVLPVLSSHCGALRGPGYEDNSRSTTETVDIHSTVVSNQFKDGNLSSQHQAQRGQTSLSACKHVDNIQSDREDKTSVEEIQSSGLLPLPGQLFWCNSENLCWLDSMLVALVNCKSLKKCRPAVEPQHSSVWQMIREYEDICTAIQGHQQSASDGVVKVSKNVLQKANADLQSLRMSIFKQLQPKLHCKLGKEETPVFALPLLLSMDTWVEPLFQSTFHWDFKCNECSTATKERVRKTLPTFTDIVSDWHPLHAVHLAPCNTCCRKHQRRTMKLESLPPVFGLHFVQGLPDNDVRKYNFTFDGNHYSITTVIQYSQHLKHFVTWICNSNGTWLEYDDLKHPECKTHGKLQIPAEEIHIVFWEVAEDKEPAACSPSSSFSDNPPPENQANSSLDDGELITDKLSDHSPDQSLLMPHNDTAIICALSAPGDTTDMDSTAVDTSIGSTTLLDAFEGLSHDDIITFTLVEITPDFDTQPVNDSGQMQSSSLPTTNGIPDSTPDSSSAESPTTSVVPKVNQDSSLEAICVTGEAIGESGMCDGTQMGKKADLSKMDPDLLPPASSELLNVNIDKSIPENPNPAALETTEQTSPVSSSGNLSLVITQKITQNMPSSFENSRWSYMLSKNPQFPTKKPEEKFAPPTLHAHSTPDPVRRFQCPGRQAPKLQLKMEDNSLPLKAAAMYNSFGIKNSATQSPLNTAPVLGSTPNLLGPVTPNHQKVLQNTVCGTSPPSLETRDHMEILSSRMCGSHSLNIPSGVSDTKVLRYKLIKKLKAKKKKLARLNEMLGYQGPDSTNINSPSTVTSSTYDGSVGDGLLMDLLSPATTASNLSPDSTSFFETIATGQGVTQRDKGVGAASQVNAYKNEPCIENFLDEFISQVASQRPTEMEVEALSALDLFV